MDEEVRKCHYCGNRTPTTCYQCGKPICFDHRVNYGSENPVDIAYGYFCPDCIKNNLILSKKLGIIIFGGLAIVIIVLVILSIFFPPIL